MLAGLALNQKENTMKTDEQIQQDVMAQLLWDPAIQATQIGVQVKEGVVSIAGQVASYTEKLHAERAARSVAGVRALAVEITVKLIGTDQRTDAELAQSALNALDWTASLEPDSVKVQVEGGWITLSGEVAWQHQRQAAADAVRHLIGTVGVGNQVAIRHKPEARIVKAEIEAAIERGIRDDVKQILVQISGTDVILSGRVQSWSERDLATAAAWNCPGVVNVVDNMTLAY